MKELVEQWLQKSLWGNESSLTGTLTDSCCYGNTDTKCCSFACTEYMWCTCKHIQYCHGIAIWVTYSIKIENRIWLILFILARLSKWLKVCFVDTEYFCSQEEREAINMSEQREGKLTKDWFIFSSQWQTSPELSNDVWPSVTCDPWEVLGCSGLSGRSWSVCVSAFCSCKVCVCVPCDVTVGAGCRGCRPIAFIRPISLCERQSVLLFLQTRRMSDELTTQNLTTSSHSLQANSNLIWYDRELNSAQGWRSFR